MILVQVFTNLLVLGLNMLKVLLSSVEVMLVLPAVVASVTKSRRNDLKAQKLTIFTQFWPILRKIGSVAV